MEVLATEHAREKRKRELIPTLRAAFAGRKGTTFTLRNHPFEHMVAALPKVDSDHGEDNHHQNNKWPKHVNQVHGLGRSVWRRLYEEKVRP
jgi:hypothetical protein